MHEDSSEPSAAADAEDVTPQQRRSPLRLALAGVLTTVLGTGAALGIMTDAYAGEAHASSPRPAASRTVALQEYVVPRSATLKKPKFDRFTAFGIPSGIDDEDDGSAKGDAFAPAGEAQRYAAKMVAARDWSKAEFGCLVSLWGRESGWNAHAGRTNGPYGIPQASPGGKMASAGADWVNDHRVQIRWGLGYIAGRYGTPCKAWANSQAHGSY